VPESVWLRSNGWSCSLSQRVLCARIYVVMACAVADKLDGAEQDDEHGADDALLADQAKLTRALRKVFDSHSAVVL